ncbi:ATP-binding cassette domain-containing protein [Corynebacterium sp. USCH3]|uniref:ABC-F family ATP-binding cassette domain-containing protein n=1 Tax=Corynebacterium sp. USCH3 TaxID=3024840 RepID=UPI0030B53D74
MTHAPESPMSTGPSSGPRRTCEIRGGTVRFAERTVLDDVDLIIGPKERIAVIGDNGAGKSTLLGMLAGSVPLAAGERSVVLPGGLALAEQHPRFDEDASVADALDTLLVEVRHLESAISDLSTRLSRASDEEQPALLAELGRATDTFEARDGYAVDQRVTEAVEQLGLGRVDRAQRVHSLSGGERARLALAAALSAEAELLLLDEPTNDLDDDALAWLEARLDAHRGSMIVVTHDRAFLDRFATDIVHVDDGMLRRYGDGYQGFLTAREVQRKRLRAEHEVWLRDLARNEALIATIAFRMDAIPRRMEKSGFGHGAFRARGRDHGASGRIRMAKAQVSRLLADPAPPPAEPLRFTPPSEVGRWTESGDEPAIAARGVRLGTGDGPRLVLDELIVGTSDRILITGPNGAGKTTLLRVLAGELVPGCGTVSHRHGLRSAWLRQELLAGKPQTLQQAFAEATGDYLDDASDRLVSFGLFQREDLPRPLSELSIGQVRRYEISVALAAPTDVLFLDEPTNHLAPELVEQLEAALAEYDGAVLTVTHDRRWRQCTASDTGTRHLHVRPGGLCVPDA